MFDRPFSSFYLCDRAIHNYFLVVPGMDYLEDFGEGLGYFEAVGLDGYGVLGHAQGT